MVYFTTTALSVLAAAGLVQYAPAPFLAIPVVISIEAGSAAAWAGAAAGIVGGAAATASAIETGLKHKRYARPFALAGEPWAEAKREDAPYGTKLAWQECHNDVKKATVGFSVEDNGTSLLVTGVPATCMTLATVITGKFNEGRPVPEGNDKIKFTKLEPKYFNELISALRARPH